MILSFHPCFEGDKNLLCAGRNPGPDDLAAIQCADAVLLPQGCSASLYDMVRRHCQNRFPNFDMRFQYPGKIGQIELFQKHRVCHPKTQTFLHVAAFYEKISKSGNLPFSFPFVFKFDWGGEGHTVFLIDSKPSFDEAIHKAVAFERTGFTGFLIQEFIPTGGRSLRVAVIGKKAVSYWRVQVTDASFYSSVSKGAAIDAISDPLLQQAAVAAVQDFCQNTGINLAGFDLIFSTAEKHPHPIFLEINYFFGREGLGGSLTYYRILERQIKIWLKNLGLSLKSMS